MAMVSDQDLFQACKMGNVEVIPGLLEALDPSVDFNQALHYAIEYGHAEIVKLLLADPRVDPSANDNSAISNAIYNGHVDVVELLLAHPKVDPSYDDNSAIFEASSSGHSEIVKVLLAHPLVDPSDNGSVVIRNASHDGHADMVQLLLTDPRVDPSACNNLAIRQASRNGHANVVKLLLADPRVDPSADDDEAIVFASRNGHADVVKLLLAHPEVKPNIIIIQRIFGHAYLTAEFFLAASSPSGLTELMPLTDMAPYLTLEMLDILISRAKAIEPNQKFLHSLRLAKLPIPVEIKLSYGTYLNALFSITASNVVMDLLEITVYFADMVIPSEIFRLIIQYL